MQIALLSYIKPVSSPLTCPDTHALDTAGEASEAAALCQATAIPDQPHSPAEAMNTAHTPPYHLQPLTDSPTHDMNFDVTAGITL